MSSSGASCFFTLFNLQGARPTSAAGTVLYHIVSSLSSAFSNFFGAFQLQTFESRTLIQLSAALAANFYMIPCSLRFVKYFFHLVVSRQARPGRCTLLLSRSLARACLYYHSVPPVSTLFFWFFHFIFAACICLYTTDFPSFLAVAERLFSYYNIRSMQTISRRWL